MSLRFLEQPVYSTAILMKQLASATSCVCVPTKNSWCTATATITATKTITSTDRITATDTITKTKTITSTDSITATDTITKTKTITDTDSFTVTDTITKTKTITDTDTATVTDTITATVTGTGIICCNSQNWLGSGSQDACRQCHSPTGSGGGNGRRFNSAATEWDTQSPCA
ncbi:hypothetical protein N7510_003318 [Penicillium lagena]|uniref:uncharacterized protein n=1 Tax=Penicillium lagena TaxID=94218 RepID=UPI002540232D|nr:uncharacterized protein N7510_003318 [Penicillium lagena]KAJ5619334.1 hypothetical protein N7510_003318 [Penicillium lagena]